MQETFSPPAAIPSNTTRNLWWWMAAGGLVVASVGALYLFTRSRRGKKTTKQLKRKVKQVKGGLLVAALAGFANKAGSAAAGKVI